MLPCMSFCLSVYVLVQQLFKKHDSFNGNVTVNFSRFHLSHLKSCKNISIEVADFAIYFLIQKMLPYELDYDYIMINDQLSFPKKI